MCYLLWGGREERIGRAVLEVEGMEGEGWSQMMNDSWTDSSCG